MIATRTQWYGEEAIRLIGGGYEALVLPGFGANCISLIHKPSGADLLRRPPDRESLSNNPNVYGLPLLFPPNRIRDGVYTFQDRTYRFPINEPARHHHIHGFLSSAPFVWQGEADFVYRAGLQKPYLTFPHAFTMRRSFNLDENGLTQTLLVTNEDEIDMPFGIGFHAAWNVPFLLGDNAEDYRLHIPATRQWVLDPSTIIPTGETLTDSIFLRALREGNLSPESHPLSCLLECEQGPVSLTGPQGRLICERDEHFRFVMLWNGGGGRRFVCPEPQSWLVDAPNLLLPWSVTGFDAIKPGEERRLQLRYAFQTR